MVPPPCHGGDAEEHRAEQGRRRDHDRAVREPVEEARQRQGGDHGAAPEHAKGEGHVGLGALHEALHDHNGVDDDHGAGRGDREVQGEQTRAGGASRGRS